MSPSKVTAGLTLFPNSSAQISTYKRDKIEEQAMFILKFFTQSIEAE